jgi:hypothetical protein
MESMSPQVQESFWKTESRTEPVHESMPWGLDGQRQTARSSAVATRRPFTPFVLHITQLRTQGACSIVCSSAGGKLHYQY